LRIDGVASERKAIAWLCLTIQITLVMELLIAIEKTTDKKMSIQTEINERIMTIGEISRQLMSLSNQSQLNPAVF
jgi:hypothetical protein